MPTAPLMKSSDLVTFNIAEAERDYSVVNETLSTHTNDELTAIDKTGKLPGLACNPAESINVPKAMVRAPQNTFALFTFPITIDGNAYTMWEAISGEAAWQIGMALGGNSAMPMPGNAGALNAADMASLADGTARRLCREEASQKTCLLSLFF